MDISHWEDICTGHSDKESTDLLRDWWVEKFRSFGGYHNQCVRLLPFVQSFRQFVQKWENERISHFYAFIQRDYRYQLVCIVEKNELNIDIVGIIEHAKQGNRHAIRFLVDYYENRDRVAHVDYASKALHANPNDQKAKRIVALAWFTGCGVPYQSYEKAIEFGMQYRLCVPQDDVKKQLPIVLRVLIDRTDHMIQSTRFVLGLRLVCRKWNSVILQCSNFWKRLHTVRSYENVTNGELGEYVISSKHIQAYNREKRQIMGEKFEIQTRLEHLIDDESRVLPIKWEKKDVRQRILTDSVIRKRRELEDQEKLLLLQEQNLEQKYKRRKY